MNQTTDVSIPVTERSAQRVGGTRPYRNRPAAVRAAGIETIGAKVRTLALPEPRALAPDEVLVEVRAAGVGSWDEFVRVGEWGVGAVPPMALGVEAAGTVSAVGEHVRQWSPGDSVLTHPVPLRGGGTWTERMIVAGDLLAPKPDTVSWEQGAAFPVPALTAAQALAAVIDDRAEGPLLVHGAGGVTGGLAVALALRRGIAVVATAGPSSAERLRSLGVASVLDYHDETWPQEVRALTDGAGAPAALNAAPKGEPQALAATADGGRFATITGAPPAAERGVSIADVYVRSNGKQLGELAHVLGSGGLDVRVACVYPLARAADALRLATHGAGGAVVVACAPVRFVG
jgi:NADPH:quinone reductase-like Zn-dependent oxidoreductase